MNKASDKSQRLLSLDALRGFDMLFIMGMSGLILNLSKLTPECGLMQWLGAQMHHVAWDGFTHHDTIFPLFLFIAGISFPFSLAKQREGGVSTARICGRIVKRGVILVLLGMVYNGLLRLQLDTLRIPSVLGRIGMAWMFAALMTVWLPAKVRAAISAILLIGYSLLLTIPAPDIAEGVEVWSRQGNLAGYIDRIVMPNHILWRGTMDPEGLLSTLPAIVTAMLGVFTGEFVRRSDVSGTHKSAIMFGAAAVMLIGGVAWGALQPINKTLWTSAFVLTAAAYSLAMFALFYYIIDVRGWQKWTGFFRVVGVNSITIYLAQRFISFSDIARNIFGGVASKLPEAWEAIILSVGYIALCWLLLYFLDRKKVYLKV